MVFTKTVEHLFADENTIMLGLLKAIPNYQSLNVTEVLQSVLAGTYDFGHVGLMEGLLHLFTFPGFKDVKPVQFTVSETKSGIVFREGAYDIKDDFVKKIKEMKEDGRLLDAYRRSLSGIPLLYYENLVPEKIVVNSNVVKGK